jgi:aspartyl-tRNA(Asn)/glutamyl-tRNA(Gln) amidotransferase subunit A
VQAWELNAVELLAAYRLGQLSPVEATRACLARIARHDEAVHAFCLVDEERALADAAVSERRWSSHERIGLLEGVPVAVKDIVLTHGWPTRRGLPASAPVGQDVDAPVTAALRRHGAVLIGKTTTPQLGWKGVTDGPDWGATRNPHDTRRTAGGSSGGSAAAVALGMAPLAVGTDGGGSIRIPAGFSGVVGFKPTFGLVALWPPSAFGSLSHVGPMARTVADAALMLDVLGEPDPLDWTQPPPHAGSFLAPFDGDLNGLRVAFAPRLDGVAVDREIAAAVAAAVRVLTGLGAEVDEIDLALDARDAFDPLWTAGAAGAVAALPEAVLPELDPGLLALAAAGRALGAVDVVAAQQRRAAVATRLARLLNGVDLLVTPTLPIPAFGAGRLVPDGWPEESWPSWTPFTYPFNLSQQPAASVPCGVTADGMPIGLQIVAARHRDQLVLRAARAYESAVEHSTLRAEPILR